MISKNAGINRAIKALRKEIQEKAWDAEYPINDYGKRCKEFCMKHYEAIRILESLKDV